MVRDYILACGGTSPPWSSAEEHFLGLYYHSTPIEQFPEYNSDEETPLPPLEDPAENPVDPQNSLSTLSENLPAPTWTWTFWKDEQVELPPECYIGDYLCLRFLLLVVMVIFCCTVLIMPATSSAAINAATYTTKGYSYLSDKLSEYHVSGYIILIPSFILWMGLEFYFWRRW